MNLTIFLNDIAFWNSHLYKMVNCAQIAITAYALALAKSSEADLAYGKLLASAKETDGLVYWGRSIIRTNR